MKNRLLALLLFLSPCYILFAQSIRGNIVDGNTGDPVAYAAIQFGPQQGVITNLEGYFEIQAVDPTFGEIEISCLGYENKTVTLNSLLPEGNIIKLNEAVVVLNEVFLSNKNPDAETIMKKVRERVNDNYQNAMRSHRVFSRETEYVNFDDLDFEISKATGVSKNNLSQTNNELDSLSRAIIQSRSMHFKDFLGELYVRDADSAKLRVDKATSLLDAKKDFSVDKIQEKAQGIVLRYLDSTASYKIKSGLFKIEDSLKLDHNTLEDDTPHEYRITNLRNQSRNVLKTSFFEGESLLNEFMDPGTYAFQFEKATFLNGELIYMLNFYPDRGRSKYEGTVFVNGNDYAIVKLNYRFAEGKRGRKINLKLLLGIKFIEDTESGTILFKKGANEHYEPSYIQRITGNYFYVSRPVKFIKNSSEKNKVTFDFILSGKSRKKEELLITRSAQLPALDFVSFKEAEKVGVIELQQYDETLWQGDEILQPLQEMRQFNAMK